MRLATPAASLLVAVAMIACGDDDVEAPRSEPTGAPNGEAAAKRADRKPPARVKPAKCPSGTDNCRTASGRVVYVEAIDPDGDGDAHLVLASTEGVTAPGISVIDVRADLRPDPLPRTGDLVSAAGPVYPGSYGQRQIEATDLHVAEASQTGR